MLRICINPPIRGSIGIYGWKANRIWHTCINPPIRGSIVYIAGIQVNSIGSTACINPPIRGSIEQDNALFENYNHKR